MDIFQALAEPTRRDIIEMLASRGQLSASDISDQFTTSAPAISQHLKVLREANLIVMEKRAQQRLYTINVSAIDELDDWAQKMKKLWNQRFDRLAELLKRQKEKIKKQN